MFFPQEVIQHVVMALTCSVPQRYPTISSLNLQASLNTEFFVKEKIPLMMLHFLPTAWQHPGSQHSQHNAVLSSPPEC